MYRLRRIMVVTLVLLFIGQTFCLAGTSLPRPCLPDKPLPPETVGPMAIPFDLPVWPTLIKTEFHILPWVSLGTFSVCLPGCSQAYEFKAPCLSLKPIPIWFPWLRPLDAECKDSEVVKIPW
ncbi:MAG: hypothetical protein PHS86_03125 [Syntrophaceae bacterium]|nr:hypothetical protein [Syntrophaceae bacterium]